MMIIITSSATESIIEDNPIPKNPDIFCHELHLRHAIKSPILHLIDIFQKHD